MKKCELCGRVAATYCESDRAILCWTCDYRVHAANFLVARHSRTLLCRICQSPTAWSAAGTMLGTAVSLCCNCARKCCIRGKAGCMGTDVGIESDGSSYEAEVAVTSSSSEAEELDKGGNQILLPRLPAASSSTSSNSDAESFCARSSASSSALSREGRRKTSIRKANKKRSSSSGFNNVDACQGSVAAAAVSPALDCNGGGRGCRRSLKRRRLLGQSRVGLSPTFSCSNGFH